MAFQKSLVFFICQCITTIVAVDALSFVSYTTYINSNSEKDVQCIQFDFRKISFISLELSDQSLHSLPRLCSPSTPDGEYRSGLWLQANSMPQRYAKPATHTQANSKLICNAKPALLSSTPANSTPPQGNAKPASLISA